MITFVTDQLSPKEPDILTTVKFNSLLIMSLEGQYLARFHAPITGWTHQALCNMNTLFESAWAYCGVDAYLGNQWVGSSEV
ncbi:hypothetical protein [Aliivibrio wodanis]|uniref:hypothetical protein n=1 Tax=Aliivibrio wodanis TaxID=80852 RepID=UPI00406D25C5